MSTFSAFLSGGVLETRLANVNNGLHGLASLYWYEPDDLVGRNFLFVAHDSYGDMDTKLAEIFAEIEEQPTIEIYREGQHIRTLRVLRCRDLQQPVPAFSRLD